MLIIAEKPSAARKIAECSAQHFHSISGPSKENSSWGIPVFSFDGTFCFGPSAEEEPAAAQFNVTNVYGHLFQPLYVMYSQDGRHKQLFHLGEGYGDLMNDDQEFVMTKMISKGGPGKKSVGKLVVYKDKSLRLNLLKKLWYYCFLKI